MKKATNSKSKKVLSTGKPEQKAAGLYQSDGTRRNARSRQPVYYQVQDTKKANTQYDRMEQIRLARYSFTQCPDLGGALIQKSQWVVGPGAFKPQFNGADKDWGKKAEEWLMGQFYPMCSTLGTNYNFTTLLNLSSLALDIDGDTGLVLTKSTTGFPQVTLVPAHRIGQRSAAITTVLTGPLKDYTITDGVITNDNGRAIGYRVLGDKPDGSEDVDILSKNFQLLFEPEWADQQRGISRIARSITDWQDQSDINEFIIRGIKLATSIALKHKTESGDGNGSAFDPGAVEDTTMTSGVQVTPINGGEIFFMKAAVGEDIEAMKTENPSPNTEAFIARIQKRAMYSIGWQQEMLDASKIGGASVRLIQDLARRSVASRQETIARRAKLIVEYAVAVAIKTGILPENKEWYKWSFSKGAQICVDVVNENKADIDNYKMGTTTLSAICAKKGEDWLAVRTQNQKEVEDLLSRADAISNKFNKPFDLCLMLLQQNSPNQTATGTTDTSVDTVETPSDTETDTSES